MMTNASSKIESDRFYEMNRIHEHQKGDTLKPKPGKKGKFTEGLLDNESILNSLNICVGQTIVDAGCGNGYMSKQFSTFAGASGKIYALDPDEVFINQLKSEVKDTNIVPLIGDITQTTVLKASSVDLVYLSTVFHLFTGSQIPRFEKEVRRILKPGAKLAIVNINKEKTPFGPPLKMRYSPEELKQKLSFTPKKRIEAGAHFYMQIFEK